MDFNSLSELLESYSTNIRYATASVLQTSNSSPEYFHKVFAGLSETRNKEFLAGRLAIMNALSMMGCAPSWIERDPLTNSPIWPSGIFGSLSHSSGLALAVVSKTPPIQGLGVDLEKSNRVIDPRIERHICTSDESEDLLKLSSSNRSLRLLLTFSAKEALYKCFFSRLPKPLLRFKNVSLKWEANTWVAIWKSPSDTQTICNPTLGYWGIDQNWLWTICWQ